MASEAAQSAVPVHRFILMTDIAQSSRLAEQFPQNYLQVLKLHDGIIEQAVSRNRGVVHRHTGDGYIALFETVRACVDAALELAVELEKIEPLALDEPLLVRIVLHGGELQPAGRDYYSIALNRASRICQACNPGQVLCSGVVASALGKPPAGAILRDLGQHYLRDLAEPEHLYQLAHGALARRGFAPLPTLANRPNNLQAQSNAFIGREQELAELKGLMEGGRRLITITAPGGYGKSRLAAHLCAEALPLFNRGVYFIELAPLRHHSDITTALAAAAGFQFNGSRNPDEQLIDYLREKEILLCLDNFEHVLPGGALVASILKEAPKVKVLVTSREPLRISGEQIYPLEPLAVDAVISNIRRQADAVELFVDRATQASSSFALTEGNSATVVAICQRLEGIPLAIELAAAWMDSFTPSELLPALDRQLELTARLSDRPGRHRSLRASFDWSWGLLTEEQRKLLMQLSTFRGGCFIDAGAAVMKDDGMELRYKLAGLGDKGWLSTRKVGEQTRFSIRDAASQEYTFEKLQESRGNGPSDLYEQSVMDHARYFSALLGREGDRLHGHGQLEALHRIGLEQQNIYEALDTLLNRLRQNAAPQELLPLLFPFARFLWEYLLAVNDTRMMLERYQELKAAVSPVDSHSPVLLWALLGCGTGHHRMAAYELAREEFSAAKKLAEAIGDRHAVAISLNNLGIGESKQGNFTATREYYAVSLAIKREMGDSYGIAASLNNLGAIEHMQGNIGKARELYAESLAIKRAIGDSLTVAIGLNNLGSVERQQGNFTAAQDLYAEALAIWRETGDRWGIAATLYGLGIVQSMQGNYAQARELYTEALAIRHEIGDRHGIASSYYRLGIVEHLQGNSSAASNLLTESLAIRRRIGDRHGIGGSLGGLSLVEYLKGNESAARELLAESLVVRLELGDHLGLCEALAAAGCMLAEAERVPSAATCNYGARHFGLQFGSIIAPMALDLLDRGTALIEHPQTGLPTAERQRRKELAEAMSLEELAQFALAELDKLKAALQEKEQTPANAADMR